ncbi:gluconokinase [Ulvibacterium sp.]|uniref:gluconokinase n=1 Tax=Ulvibacterium sp. TaxID=2665914 RepID=UPI00260B672F|nr:gluconokinase [Ulvibacterium sp.]
MNETTVFLIMGVSGSGKSTVGKLLATELNVPFFDGDDYHPEENVTKMAAGNPLNDADRIGWLKCINILIKENLESGAIIACSALKKSYRSILTEGVLQKIRFIYLKGSFEEVRDRMQKRKGHFMPTTLLKSQFDTLEPPQKAISVTIQQSPASIVLEILEHINEN